MSTQELAQLAARQGFDKWNGPRDDEACATHLESPRQQPITLFESA